MTDDALQHFENRAGDYEAERRRVVPGYDTFYGTAVAALALGGREIRRVLDLGAGTGLLAAHVAAAHPNVELTLLDGAAGMLDHARETFADRATYVRADLADPLRGSAWDAIVSALAIHHLDDADKRELFARVHARCPVPARVHARWHRAGSSSTPSRCWGRPGSSTTPTTVGTSGGRRSSGPLTLTGAARSRACATTAARRSSTSSPGYAKPASPTPIACGKTTASPYSSRGVRDDRHRQLMLRLAYLGTAAPILPDAQPARVGAFAV